MRNMRNLPDLFSRERFLSDFFSPFTSTMQQLFDRTFRVDVKETESNLVIEAELPGLKKEQIDVDVTENGIRISTQTESNVEEGNEKENYYRKERNYERSERFIPFPISVQTEEGKASYRDGILTITFPKVMQGDSTKKRLDIE